MPPNPQPPDWLPRDWLPSDQSPPDQRPPSTPPVMIDHGLQAYLPTRAITASKCISEFTRSRPPSASRNSLNHGLQGHLWVHSISRSPSGPPNSLNDGFGVRCQAATAVVRRYRCNGGGQSNGSAFSADPRVDIHHLISISSYHPMKIHTLSFTTCGLTRSVRDCVDPPNCMDPQCRVVSYLLTQYLCSSNQNRSFLWIPFWCPERCAGVLIVGSLPSSSLVSPQWPPSGASLSTLNGRVQVLLRLCSSTICGQIERMYIYRDLNNTCRIMM